MIKIISATIKRDEHDEWKYELVGDDGTIRRTQTGYSVTGSQRGSEKKLRRVAKRWSRMEHFPDNRPIEITL